MPSPDSVFSYLLLSKVSGKRAKVNLHIRYTTNSSYRYASLQVNYLTIPVYVVGAISLVIQAHFSDKYEQRALFLVGSAVPVITGYLICVGTSNAVAGYVAMFILSMGQLCLSINFIIF